MSQSRNSTTSSPVAPPTTCKYCLFKWWNLDGADESVQNWPKLPWPQIWLPQQSYYDFVDYDDYNTFYKYNDYNVYNDFVDYDGYNTMYTMIVLMITM